MFPAACVQEHIVRSVNEHSCVYEHETVVFAGTAFTNIGVREHSCVYEHNCVYEHDTVAFAGTIRWRLQTQLRLRTLNLSTRVLNAAAFANTAFLTT